MSPNQKKDESSRIHSWEDELVIDAMQGLARRFGTSIFEANELTLCNLIKQNCINKEKGDNMLFWATEVTREFQHRITTGRITWPIKK
jgi:hypothetical protein